MKILSIDGGGMRGIAPLQILKYIEDVYDKPIHEQFDLIVGTSTGAMIAAGLTCSEDGVNPKYSVEDIIKLYTENGNRIFPVDNYIMSVLRDVKTIFAPMYSCKGIESVLNEYFGDLKLSNTLKPIIITSYDIRNNEVVMFKSRYLDSSDEYDIKLKDACRASSAAPVYFKPYRGYYDGKERLFVDGGIYVNNPSMVGISDMIKVSGLNETLKDIRVMSLGTGLYSNELGITAKRWNIIKWLPNITNIMMQASAKSVVYDCEQMLSTSEGFVRYQPIIMEKKYSKMNDASFETMNYIRGLVHNDLMDEGLKYMIHSFIYQQ